MTLRKSLIALAAILICVVLAKMAFVQGRAPQNTAQTPVVSQASPATGSPVVVGGKTIFYVRERVFSFSPEDRAKAIMDKIRRLAEESPASIRGIRTEDAETTTAIVSAELVIMTVTERDAAAAGRPRQVLAAEYAQEIRSAAELLRKNYGVRTILLGILWSALATAVFLVVLKLMGILFRKFYGKVRSWHGTYIRSIRIQKLELVPAERITGFLLLLSRIVRFLLFAALLYFYVSLVFSFFPWTRGYASVLIGYLLYPLRTVGQSTVAFLPNIFFIAVIVGVSYYVNRFVKFFFNEVGRGTITLPGFYSDWAQPTYAIARFLIIALTAVVVFPYLPGSKSPAFQGVSIFLGLLFSFGSSSAIANIVSGVVLTYTRAFQIGDRVKVGDAMGDVTEKTLLVTRIRTIKNVDISIPNAMVLGAHIINFSSSAADRGLILHTSVTIGYDAPWKTVHGLLIDAARSTEDIVAEPQPFVFQTSLDDFYVTYELNAFTKRPNEMAQIYSELHQNIQNKFNEAGVEIMSPHYSQLRDGNQTTIPETYLSKGYAAPAFRYTHVDMAVGDKSVHP